MIFVLYRLLVEQSAKNGEQALGGLWQWGLQSDSYTSNITKTFQVPSTKSTKPCWIMVLKMLEIVTMRWFTWW
jgi:hypothetical protein